MLRIHAKTFPFEKLRFLLFSEGCQTYQIVSNLLSYVIYFVENIFQVFYSTKFEFTFKPKEKLRRNPVQYIKGVTLEKSKVTYQAEPP